MGCPRASPLGESGGYWTGTGSVTLSSGNTERVKCAVIYKVSDDGSPQIKQSMRCASTDYKHQCDGGSACEGRAGVRQLGREDLFGHG